MSIIYNGTEIKKLIYNGTECKEGYWGDTKVYSSAPDPTGDSFTQDEFIYIINNSLQSQMKVGALITLNNVYCDTYEVIGVNHDNTKNTVDIMSHTQVGNIAYSWSQPSYVLCNLRNYLTGTYFNAFDNSIQNLAKTMLAHVSDGSYLYDKVKAPSCTELGNKPSEAYSDGNSYGLSKIWRDAGSYGNSSWCWTRTINSSSEAYVWKFDPYGVMYNGSWKYGENCGTLAILRF